MQKIIQNVQMNHEGAKKKLNAPLCPPPLPQKYARKELDATMYHQKSAATPTEWVICI